MDRTRLRRGLAACAIIGMLCAGVCWPGDAQAGWREDAFNHHIVQDVLAPGGAGQSTNGSGARLISTLGQPAAGTSTLANGARLIHGVRWVAPRPAGPNAVRDWCLYE